VDLERNTGEFWGDLGRKPTARGASVASNSASEILVKGVRKIQKIGSDNNSPFYSVGLNSGLDESD